MIVYRYVLYSQRTCTVVWNSSLKLSDIIHVFSCQQSYCNSMSFIILLLSSILFIAIFTLSIQIMFSLIPSDANDPRGLMRHLAPNKQSNKNKSLILLEDIILVLLLCCFFNVCRVTLITCHLQKMTIDKLVKHGFLGLQDKSVTKNSNFFPWDWDYVSVLYATYKVIICNFI